MPTPSPSPAKRPQVQGRSLSTVSLSSSGKPAGAGTLKQSRPHFASRHSRNVSHGKVLSNMGKKPMTAVYGDGKNHARKKSGTTGTTPSASPKPTTASHLKRNASHVILPKNRSHGNLRKNQSTNALTALNRNPSRNALNKLGAPPEQKEKQEQQRQGVFDLGNSSSEEEDGGEWEDSTASPELTRNNSKAPTPIRAQTPSGEPIQKPPDKQETAPEKTSSPETPVVIKTNRSAPNLRYERAFSSDGSRQNPALLQQNGRASRAPPAMSTANARSSQVSLNRNESQRSLLKSGRSSVDTSNESISKLASQTPSTFAVGQSSSGSAGISHFLTNETSLPQSNKHDSDDDESISDFMSTYKPQPSESPENPRTTVNKARLSSQPSRTQQKLELQRREAMRGNGPSTPGAGVALSVGSSISVHSRSASKGRNRSIAGDIKYAKQDYESAVKQLTVVRRFRNPVLESLARLKQAGTIETTANTVAAAAQTPSKRPPSRQGRPASTGAPNGVPKTSTGTTPDDSARSQNVSFRPSHGRDSKVQFQLSRQGSHDDILTTSQGSPDMNHDDVNYGLSAEEALIRRMWESRVHVS